MVQYTAPTSPAVSQGGTVATQTQQSLEEQATQTALIQQHTCTQTTGPQTATSVGCQTEQQAPAQQAAPAPVQSSFTYSQHVLLLPEEGRRECISVSWAQLAQHVEQLPSCAKSSFTKLLLEHLAVRKDNTPWGHLSNLQPAHHDQEQLRQEQQQQQLAPTDASLDSSGHDQGHGSHSSAPRLLICDRYGIPMPNLEHLLKSRTAFDLSLFCWPALGTATSMGNPSNLSTRTAGTATVSQVQPQPQDMARADATDTAQGADQQQRRHGMAKQQAHARDHQQGQQHQCSMYQADMPPLLPQDRLVFDGEQLAAFLRDALRLAQQGTADGISSEVVLQREHGSPGMHSHDVAATVSPRPTDSGSPGPAEIQALAVKLLQQLGDIAAQLIHAGCPAEQLDRLVRAQAVQHRAQYRAQHTPQWLAGQQASRAAIGQQGSGPAGLAVNQDLLRFNSNFWSEDEDGLLWETELAAVAAQEAADRLAAVDTQPEAAVQHPGHEYAGPVTVSPARSSRHARSHVTSPPTRWVTDARQLTPAMSNTQSTEHHEGETALPGEDSSHGSTTSPVQQLLVQYSKIKQRRARLKHAWEQGLRAGVNQLCQITATCCWAAVVQHYHMQQAQRCWHVLLQQPSHVSTSSPLHTRQLSQQHINSSVNQQHINSSVSQQHINSSVSQQHINSSVSEDEAATGQGMGFAGAHVNVLAEHQRQSLAAEDTAGNIEGVDAYGDSISQQLYRMFGPGIFTAGLDPACVRVSNSSMQRLTDVNREAVQADPDKHAAVLLELQQMRERLKHEVGLTEAAVAANETAQQTAAELQKRLDWSEAQPAALAGATSEELTELITQLETRLSRARTAQTQAVANQEQMCPVCWERRKGLVFQCGHQTCEACAEKLTACPICRVQISLRIKTY